MTDKLGTPSYCLFCDTPWRRSGANVDQLLYFVLSLWTVIPNWSYRDSKTLNMCVVCIGFYISLCGAYQALVCLLINCSCYAVLKLAAQNYSGLRSKTMKVIFDSFRVFIQQEVICFRKTCQPLGQLKPETGESLEFL